MKIANLPAFLAGIVAVVVTRVVLIQVGAQPLGTAAAIDVCVDAGGVMRVAVAAVACNAGERRVRLRGPEREQACEPLPRRDLSELSRRVSELEGRGGDAVASPVIEPFEVVNEAGTRVFSLQQDPADAKMIATEINNETGMQVVVIAANAGGGAVTFGSPRVATSLGDGGLSTTIAAHGSSLGFTTRVSSDKRIELGRRANGRFGLSVYGANDKVAAFIGESLAGTGLVGVADVAGVPRVTMFRAESGSGMLRIQNAQSQEMASLSAQAHAGSGLLQLRNNAGEVMVEAGMLPTGVGAVRAGPAAFNHGIMFLGLPASYIVGKKQ